MEKILLEVLNEVKRIGEDTKELKKDNKQLRKEMDKRFIEQRENIRKEIDGGFNQQSKEIAQELRDIVGYFEKKQRKQERLNKKVQEEIKNNKITQDGYNARIYKIERVQSDFESRIYNLENREKIAN